MLPPTSGLMLPLIAKMMNEPLRTTQAHAQKLRDGGLLAISGRGNSAAIWGTPDGVNVPVSLAIATNSTEAVKTVLRVRELPPHGELIELPVGYTQGLTFFDAVNAGCALENMLNDIRSGRLSEWAAGESYKLKVNFSIPSGSMAFMLRKPMRHETDTRDAIRSFAHPGFYERARNVERNVTISGDVFLRIAEKLGPP
jgi:hypothetical protein